MIVNEKTFFNIGIFSNFDIQITVMMTQLQPCQQGTVIHLKKMMTKEILK